MIAKTDAIPANSSKTYFPIDAPSPFNGSVIIESDQQVVAIVNTVGDGIYFASTTGFSSGSTSTNLPLLMKGNAGFDTWFNVQNCGTVSTNVTVTYSNATNRNGRHRPRSVQDL